MSKGSDFYGFRPEEFENKFRNWLWESTKTKAMQNYNPAERMATERINKKGSKSRRECLS